MKKITSERQTALKLVNKYADEYRELKKENKILKKHISNISMNQKINKEIIEGLVKNIGIDDKYQLILIKLNEEIALLSGSAKEYMQERKELIRKMSSIQEETYSQIKTIQKCSEKQQLKTFFLENIITKKDNEIQRLNERIEAFYKSIVIDQIIVETSVN